MTRNIAVNVQQGIIANAQELEAANVLEAAHDSDSSRENSVVIETNVCDFVLESDLNANDFLPPRRFEGPSVSNENLIAFDDTQHLPSRIEEGATCYNGVMATLGFFKL
ncbi:hypothetical protein L195_g052951 [Trifolium pratense]|uniref:Uncharacterized protein n=1 Tax=Trifolium pratense TaxID=57577 RepID=A0A2K3K7W2_TRIPR|nr:hypothetical protein L195_g052951 [Trifolium pratense]